MPQQQMTPEQVEELKEKLKNMSPEELREFQKKQCIFCHIVAGKVQSKKIYEDDRTTAILDINPANPGHILLLPKEHYSIMPQMPEDEIAHIFMVAKALSNACLRSLEAQGTNIIVANGIAAGQRANHFVVHIIPRKENDGINFVLPQRKITEKELVEVRNKLAKKIVSLTGKKVAETKQEKTVSQQTTMPPKKVVEADFKEVSEMPGVPEDAKKPFISSIPADHHLKDAGLLAPKKGKKENKRAKTKQNRKTKGKKETGVLLDDIANLLKK